MKTFQYNGHTLAAGSRAAELLQEKKFKELNEHLQALEAAKNKMEGSNPSLLTGIRVYKSDLVETVATWEDRIFVNPKYWDQFLKDVDSHKKPG